MNTLFSFYSSCVSNSVFALLVGIPVGIRSSAVGLEICVITAGIKMGLSPQLRKRQEHEKIALLAKS